jgi:hypothetical protein
MTIYVFSQGANTEPSGGVRILFDLVKCLKRSGINSKILIPNGAAPYKVTWFDYDDVEIVNDFSVIKKEDIIVLHEETLWVFESLVKKYECKHVIFNQGAHWSLTNYLGYFNTKKIYEEAEFVLVNSDHTRKLVQTLFGDDVVQFQVRLGVEKYFSPAAHKENRICYMPRVNREMPSETAECIVQYVKDVHSDWELFPIKNMNHKSVAEILSTSKIFLSFGGPEGFGLPPLEAALSGCKVIGYHGFGGEEFFHEPLFTEIPFMDIPLFLDQINVYTSLLKNTNPIAIQGAQLQIEKLSKKYSPLSFEEDVIRSFKTILR